MCYGLEIELKDNSKRKLGLLMACGRAVDQKGIATWNLRPLLYRQNLNGCLW
jgi:hypothetical protein